MLGLRRRRFAVILVAQVITWPWLGLPAMANANTLPPTVAAVVDHERVLLESAASKSIVAQQEDRRKIYQEEIEQEQQRLLEAEREFAKQRSVLSQDAANAKQQEIEQEIQSLRELTEKRLQQIDQARIEALGEVERALFEVVGTIAEERGFNVVLPKSQLLFFTRQIDVTEEVIAQLDAMLPEVTVNYEAD
ncbi:MAG: OmpH family outer membrane protein [Pseudomonadota bacterium]